MRIEDVMFPSRYRLKTLLDFFENHIDEVYTLDELSPIFKEIWEIQSISATRTSLIYELKKLRERSKVCFLKYKRKQCIYGGEEAIKKLEKRFGGEIK